MLPTTPCAFRLPRRSWPLLIPVLAAVLVAPAAADTAGGEEDPDRRPRAAYLGIADAWEREDPGALAELVHPDGLQVRVGRGGRATSYSPSQSFYYFKNLFRSGITESFDYLRQQRATGPRVHAMAVWRYREAEDDPLLERRFVLVLARSGDDWLLTEINAVR